MDERRWVREEPRFAELRDRLLACGGSGVRVQDVPLWQPLFDELLDRGKVMDRPTRRVRGRVGYCHHNSLGYLLSHRSGPCLATGWALDSCGLWFQHSWVVKPGWGGWDILETTPNTCERYYGVIAQSTEEVWAFETALHEAQVRYEKDFREMEEERAAA